ncbi:MAG TPA: hypothetical protein VLK56_00660 [Solirubrobacterales bacterium]|nr:hypothetical protein [Solirubrobacterales bacterium]
MALKGIALKQLRPRTGTAKYGILAAATAFAALCVSASALAAPYAPPASPEASVATVLIKGGIHEKLRFVAPKTIVAGEELKVENTTNPKQVGPHTFSLVAKSEIPKTAKERQLCFTKGHICKAIAGWHGVKGNGPVKVNPVEVDPVGWSTLGSLTEKGDSWFTGTKPHASITQPVTAETAAGPTTIYFMCAIHPWMHGSIEVLPGT